jgi:branched-chain amino acid transport system permease protein
MKFSKWQLLIPVVIVVFLFVLPTFMHSTRYISLFNQLFLNIVLAMGVYSLWTVGYINAAQPVFYGLGAYTAAILMIKVGLSFWIALPIAGIIPAVIALLFGFVGLKLKGAYFLFLTIALCNLIIWIFISWKGLFNGQIGFYPIPQPVLHIFGYKVNFETSLTPYYYMTFILAIITCLVYFKINNSRLGRVWDSVGKNEDLLANTGISVFTQKQISLSLSCFFAGLAGAIYAPYLKVVSPSGFSLWQGIWIVLGVLVGGIFSPIGAIIGTVFMSLLYLLLQHYSQVQPLILGLILVLVLLFMPTGLFGLPVRIRNKIRDMTGNKAAQTDEKKVI